MVISPKLRTFACVIKKQPILRAMKRNYRVTIERGEKEDSFYLLGRSKEAVRSLCNIVHLGTGWRVKNVELATKSGKTGKRLIRQLCLF